MISSKPGVLLVLHAWGKCAVVREEIIERGKLLRGLCALTYTVKTLAGPPVQVSVADSWGSPDIDVFLCCRPPTPRCMTVSTPTLGKERSHRRTHVAVTLGSQQLNVARSQTELQRGSPLSPTSYAVSQLFWQSFL